MSHDGALYKREIDKNISKKKICMVEQGNMKEALYNSIDGGKTTNGSRVTGNLELDPVHGHGSVAVYLLAN